MPDVVVTRTIAASPATVFSFFADIERWTSWQGVEGEVDLQPGGVFRVRMPGAQVASGRVVEVVPDQRLVFTWGWEGAHSPVPPGTTTVVIELEPDGAGTLLRLTHSELSPPPVAEHHRLGWSATSSDCAYEPRAETPGPIHPRWNRRRVGSLQSSCA